MEPSPDTRLQSESKVFIYSFETISIKKVSRVINTPVVLLSYNYMMRFISYDSIETRLFISYCFQICTVTEHQYRIVGVINHTV